MSAELSQLSTPRMEQPDSAEIARWWQIQDFLSHECELLDQRRFDEWLECFEPDVLYRIPIGRNVRRDRIASEFTDAHDAAWIDEELATLAKRVAQLKTGMHWAEEPVSRVSRMVTNIRVKPAPADAVEVEVSSRFLIYQNRLDAEVSLFAGRREDVLRHTALGWRIARRHVFIAQSVLLSKALTIFF